MWHDFDAIPEAAGRRDGVGSALTRIYHDIGLAAVANALSLTKADFDGDLARSLERGERNLVLTPRPARVDLAA